MRDFMITLLICSVTMSILAVLYIAMMPALEKRYSAKGRYYAWLIIVIGLIIPFRPQFDQAIIKVEMPSETGAPVLQIGNGEPINIPIPISEPAHIVNEAPSSSSAKPGISLWQIGAAIWLLGMMVFLIYHAIKHYRFVKLTARWSEDITDEQMLTLYQNLKTVMGISKQIDIKLCAGVGSPLMLGFVSPKILLSKTVFTLDELRFILKHELIHYKRKDLWYKSLVLIANAVNWFNPIVYMATRSINVLCELSCDDEVIRDLDADARQFYSETIIGVVRHRSKLITAFSTNFYGGKKGMKKRIYSIMDTRKKRRGMAIICAALVVTLGTGVAFAFSGETVKENPASWDNFPTEMVEHGFLPAEIVDALPDFGKEVKENGLTLYSWNVQNENEDGYNSNIYLAVTDNIMTAYHYLEYDYTAPRLNEALSMDDAAGMVNRFAERFIPYAEYLSFEHHPRYYNNYDPERVKAWAVEYPGIGEYAILVDLEMGGVIFFTFTPSEFAGMTKTLAADGSIATIKWDKETYVPFGAITDTSLFRKFSFVNGDVNDIIFGLEDYTLRDWMINYDESKATYILLKAESVTVIPPELEKWENTLPVSNAPDITNIASLTLDNNGNNDDAAQLIQHIPEGKIYADGVEIVVTLGDGRILTKSYEGFWFSSIQHADLLGNGQQALVINLYYFGSNYSAMDCHVLSVSNGELIEILTVLDNPSESPLDLDIYRESLFEIPRPEDNFGFSYDSIDEDGRTSVCTNASIVYIDGRAALKIQHLMREVTPHSILRWNGFEWTVVEQGVD